MADCGLVALHRGLIESFKSLLTSQDFGTEFELLSTELSIQLLRVHLWGDWVGLNIENVEETPQVLLDRRDATSTIRQVLDSISFLLMEIREIRQKYQPDQPPQVPPKEDAEASRSSKSVCHVSNINRVSFRQRMRVNQRQNSMVSIARWALRDARKFDAKVKRLKSLIDGLEDISRIAGISPVSRLPLPARISVQQDESPPPYSAISRPVRSRSRVETERTTIPATTIPVSRFSSDLLNQHTIMKRYLATLPSCQDHPVPRAREKLTKLSDKQFKELRIDVYDELLRRQQCEMPNSPTPECLTNIASLHPKRNEARKKLSTLIPSRFGHLATDIVCELERRVPNLKPHCSPQISAFHDPFLIPRTPETRRWGCVRPHTVTDAPPPLLQYRAAHQSTNGTAIGVNTPWPRNPSSLTRATRPPSLTIPTPPFIHRGARGPSVEIFKSFRVSMEDPTWKILPAALKKYRISAPWEDYALYLVYGNQERCLGMDEKPLVLFKKLDKEGKKPMFMLRKIRSVTKPVAFEHYVSQPDIGSVL